MLTKLLYVIFHLFFATLLGTNHKKMYHHQSDWVVRTDLLLPNDSWALSMALT